MSSNARVLSRLIKKNILGDANKNDSADDFITDLELTELITGGEVEVTVKSVDAELIGAGSINSEGKIETVLGFSGPGSEITGVYKSNPEGSIGISKKSVSESFSIPEGNNAISIGDIDIIEGVEVSVGLESTWAILL